MKDAIVVFKAISDPTRRQILQALKGKDLPAGEIAAMFTISAPSISRHLSILKSAELISERRQGNSIIYRLQPEHLAICLSDFISAVCPREVLERKIRRKKP
jgi:DNA-binding transcriptional ArsR family regulator